MRSLRDLLPAGRDRHATGAGRRARSGSPSARSRASPAAWARRSAAAAPSQLVYVADGAEGAVGSTLGFLLSPKSAYVSGQVVRIGTSREEAGREPDWQRPLAGKVALVTGAARGIGEQIARVLARDGATVVGVDVPQAADDLITLTKELGGDYLTLDITAKDAPKRIAQHLTRRTAASTSSCTTPASPATSGSPTWTRTAGTRSSTSTWSRRSGSPAELLAQQRDPRQRPDHRRRLDRGHRRQPRPDQLRRLQGRRDRPGRLADGRPEEGHHRQRGRARLHRDQDDRRRAVRHPRGRPPAQLDEPGRPAGRRRRDDRVVRQPGLDRASTATSSGSAAR